MTTESGFAHTYLGRSLRPWWGASPLGMIVRGVVQIVVFGVVAYVGLQLRAGEFDLDEVVAAGTLDSIGLVVLLVAALFIAVNVVRIVVAVLDLPTAHTVEGKLVSCRERRWGDFVPGFVQDLIWSRGVDGSGHQKYDRRRVRTMLVVNTSDGLRTWMVNRANLVGDATPGRRVKVRVTRLLGHVSRVE